jgi:RHS repeat-associated protein
VKRADGSVLYYVSDDPGNVVGLVNASNQEVARYRYDPFGAVEYSSDPTLQPLGYHGAYRDAENLVYLRNRWYDPELQRFLSEDPIGLAGGINRYTFVGNGPMDGRDPSGLCPQWLVDQAAAGSEVAQAACPGASFGAPIGLAGLTATAPSWPFSTSRQSGSGGGTVQRRHFLRRWWRKQGRGRLYAHGEQSRPRRLRSWHGRNRSRGVLSGSDLLSCGRCCRAVGANRRRAAPRIGPTISPRRTAE